MEKLRPEQMREREGLVFHLDVSLKCWWSVHLHETFTCLSPSLSPLIEITGVIFQFPSQDRVGQDLHHETQDLVTSGAFPISIFQVL